MIYFLHGTDFHKSREKLREMLGVLKKKRPNAEVFRLTDENWNDAQFDELLGSQGLFDQKYIVVLDKLFERKEIKSYVLDRLDALRDGENVFLIIEEKVDATTLKKITVVAKQAQEFAKHKSDKKKGENIFKITRGILDRDKKKLWIDFVDFTLQGISSEEIHGVLFWQVKNMILAAKAKDAKDAGLAPFPYKNALSGSRKYKTDELVKMSSELVEMTHLVRSGNGDLHVMLEKWILEMK